MRYGNVAYFGGPIRGMRGSSRPSWGWREIGGASMPRTTLVGTRFVSRFCQLMIGATLLVTGCREDSGGGGAGTGGAGGSGGSGGGGAVQSIRSLRMTPPMDGTPVTVKAAVVVGWVTSRSRGDIYVQDMGGGEYSGIHLYCNFTSMTSP